MGMQRSSNHAPSTMSADGVDATPSPDETSCIALILPKHRLREWHRELLAHIGRTHEVNVFLDDRSPPYSLAIQLWLKLERLTLRSCTLAKPIAPEKHWRPVSALGDLQSRTVINLSECSGPHPNALEIRYDGALDSRALADRLLSQKSPCLTVHRAGHEKALVSSRLAIEEKLSIVRGLQAAFARCISLVARGLEQVEDEVAGVTSEIAVPRRGSLLAFILEVIARKVSNVLMRPFRHRDHWHVALRDGARTFKVIEDDGERFYADPFVQMWQGRTFLLVEEYPYATRRGIISAAEVVGDEILAPPTPVLTRPYHLSYPFIFEHDGDIYMMPETGENRSLELYRAVEFPWKWELNTVLMEGAVFSDATALFHNGLWWIFVTADSIGASTQDQLSIFYSDTLQGIWTAHRANPVKSDSRSSRPAGRILRQNGRLFRPAQNCEESYGAGIVWFEITELSPERFSERQVVAWDGCAELGATGLHSFDQLGGLQVIDFAHSIGRGWLRRRLRTVTPRDGGNMDACFSRTSHHLQLDRLENANPRLKRSKADL